MAKLYVLASIPEAGKTTTAIKLAEQFKAQGKKVACIQSVKGESDIGWYLKHNQYIYSMPRETAKDLSALEKWLPVGYDIYIYEITLAYSTPFSAARISAVGTVNEVVPFDKKDTWNEHLAARYINTVTFKELVDSCITQRIITNVPLTEVIDGPYVDTNLNIYNIDQLAYIDVMPRMEYPTSDKKVIAVGAFPAEYWDIYHDLTWYGYDYAAFMDRYKQEDYELVIIGSWSNQETMLDFKPVSIPVICYSLKLYMRNINEKYHSHKCKTDKLQLYENIKNLPVGTYLAEDDECVYASMNNKYWVSRTFVGLDTLIIQGNLTICNGWMLPQYLIENNFLEV